MHRGPVWLDGVETKTLANWGLGADVRQAVAERGEARATISVLAAGCWHSDAGFHADG